MSFHKIHLRKLLIAFEQSPADLKSTLRDDIRSQLKKEAGVRSDGGDFYTPFWSDAKSHVAGNGDLRAATDVRISAAPRSRGKLYPLFRDGFLRWWDDRRRAINEDILIREDRVAGILDLEISAGGVVKTQNLLSVEIGSTEHWHVYGYFNKDGALGPEVARQGLWALSASLIEVAPDDLRILDVRQGREFSFQNTPLRGNEEQLFTDRYRGILAEWARLRSLYP